MSSPPIRGPLQTGTLAFFAALFAGVVVAWEPRYWHVTVAVTAISLATAVWAVTAREIELPWQTGIAAALALWGPLQMMFHRTVVASMTLRASIVWIGCLCAFVTGSQLLRRKTDRDVFLILSMWTMTALGAIAMLQAHSNPVKVFGLIPAESSVVGTMFYKNQFAALMELGAPLALWRVAKGRVVSGGVCFAIMFGATVMSASRSGTILVLAEFLAFLAVVIVGRRMPVMQALGVAGALVLLLGGALLVTGAGEIWTRMQEPNPYHMREQLAGATFQMIADRPWSGFGVGTWRAVYPGYATLDMAVIANEAHNDLAQWAAEGGAPFLGLILLLALSLIRPVFLSLWGLGLLAVLAHCYVDYPMREPALQFLWFGLAGALTLPGGNPRSPHRALVQPDVIESRD